MIPQIIPQLFIDHLEDGGMIMIVATPLNEKLKPAVFGVDIKHIYEAHVLPMGGYVHDKPIEDFPEGTSAEEILNGFLEEIMRRTKDVGGAVAIDICVAEQEDSKHKDN